MGGHWVGLLWLAYAHTLTLRFNSKGNFFQAQGLLDGTASEHGRAIIDTMLWHNYSSRGTSEPSILKHATRSKPHGLMDHGLIYGDYYFVEALTRLLKPDLPV